MSKYPPGTEPTTDPYCQALGCATKSTALAAREIGPVMPRRAIQGTDLCSYHHEQFRRLLGDLVVILGDLQDKAYAKTKTGDAASDRNSAGAKDYGFSWNVKAVEVIAEVTEWVEYLVDIVTKYKPVPAPLIRPEVKHTAEWVDGVRVLRWSWRTVVVPYTHGLERAKGVRLQLAILWQHHADWLSWYPTVGRSLLVDAFTHWHAGRAAMLSGSVKVLRLQNAKCQEIVGESDLGPLVCGAPLYATLQPRDADDKPLPGFTSSKIICSTNPRHVQLPRERWREFADAAARG